MRDRDGLTIGTPCQPAIRTLFMTTITIDSTRHYVQFIYRNYNIYRELYGAGA